MLIKQACYIKCMQMYNIIIKDIKQYTCACVFLQLCAYIIQKTVYLLLKITVSYQDYVAVVTGENGYGTLAGWHWQQNADILREKSSPIAALSTTNSSMYTGWRELKPDLCSEMPVTNSLKGSMAPIHIRLYEMLWYYTRLKGWKKKKQLAFWRFKSSEMLCSVQQYTATWHKC
jgi:hypothetical protein